MVSERLTFSRRIILLVGALVVVRAVNGAVIVWGGRQGGFPRREPTGEGWLWTSAR